MQQIHLKRPGLGAAAEITSVLYLALPLALFFAGWLKWYVAFVALAALTLCLAFYIRSVLRINYKPKIQLRRAGLVAGLVAIIVWVLISGIGGLTPQTSDFNKHNAVTYDLVTRSWPVVYDFPQGKEPLVYYVAYYLPAATAGKIFHHSVRVAHGAMLLWSLIGMVLVFYWLSRLAGKSTLLLALLFIGFSGMDIVGSIAMQNADASYPIVTRGSEIEWYSGLTNMQYSSDTTSLFWTPQHAIAGWLLAGMLASIFVEKRRRYGAIFLGILGVLWTPFGTIGLLPIFVCLYLTSRDGWKQAITMPDIVAVIVMGGILALFFKSGSREPLQTFLAYDYTPYSLWRKIGVLVLFLALEFGIYALLLYRYMKTKEVREWLILFLACTVFLTVLPFLRMGTFNDLVMRASIPALALLAIMVYRFMASRQADAGLQRRQQLIWMVLGLGLVTPLIEFNTHLISKPLDINSWGSIANLSLDPHQEEAMNQYRGNDHSRFFRDLAQTNE
jgi:hypothetical protein